MTRGENRMAKLIRVEKNPRGLSYLDTYYFECSDCGKEYFRHANNKRISPYCGKCQRKHDNEKQKERLKAKKNQSIIEELEKMWEKIRALPDINPDYPMDKTIHISRYEVQKTIYERISELKGEKLEGSE